jgi:anaerobic selenocysteine-containing dehydrogenase
MRDRTKFTGVVETLCMQCHDKCKIQAEVENGELIRIKGCKCEKGVHLPELLYHPNRLLYPQKRAREKGNGKWERISWDEALDIMAKRFEEIRENHGPQANCVGLSCHHKPLTVTASHLALKLLNTPNILDSNHRCSKGGGIANHYTFGEGLFGRGRTDYVNSKCILIWGTNTVATEPEKAEFVFSKAQKSGAKVIVIDPRPTPTAKRADIWLQIRPQSDGALALGFLNILINEGLYDKEFVEKNCLGFEKLKERVQDYPPERVSEITWIPKEKIIETARLYGKTHPSCIRTKLGVDGQSLNTTQASRAIACLAAIKGDLDIIGGNLVKLPQKFEHGRYESYNNHLDGFKGMGWLVRNWRTSPELEKKRVGSDKYPVYSGSRKLTWWDYNSNTYLLMDAIVKGKVRGLYLPGVNPVAHEANSKRIWKVLGQADFMVVADHFMSPTAELADLVLPAAHWAEVDIATGTPCAYDNELYACPKIVEPSGECWDDRKIVIALSDRIGRSFPWRNIAEQDIVGEWNDYTLKTVKITFDELLSRPKHLIEFPFEFKKYEKSGWKWNTPTGKIELYCPTLEKLGYDPLPAYKEDPVSPLSRPDLWKEYPLIVINHRERCYEHSEGRQSPSLRKKIPEPEIEIHPQMAKDLGLKEGDWMWLESYQMKGEKVKGKAKFVDELHPNVVSTLVHWWFPERPEPEHGCFESNINTIISDGPPFEPFNGHSQTRGILCRAGKV